MKRREFITLLGGGAAWPLVASAQQLGKIYRIGYLSPTTGLEARDKAFLQGLQELGYIEASSRAKCCKRQSALPLYWACSFASSGRETQMRSTTHRSPGGTAAPWQPPRIEFNLACIRYQS